jgi:hypothetical protein
MSHFGTGGVRENNQETSMSNALVPLTPADRAAVNVRATCRPHADFIAHLIATSAQAPQTRQRRRAAPGEATEIYRARGDVPIRLGRKLSLSL